MGVFKLGNPETAKSLQNFAKNPEAVCFQQLLNSSFSRLPVRSAGDAWLASNAGHCRALQHAGI